MPKPTRRQAKKQQKRQQRIRQDKHVRHAAGLRGAAVSRKPAARQQTKASRRIDFTPERIQRLLTWTLAQQPDTDPEEVAGTLVGQQWRAPYRDMLAADPHERAQDFAFQAIEAKHPSQRRRFIREALDLNPACLDALGMQWQFAGPPDTWDTQSFAGDLLDAIKHFEQQPDIASQLASLDGRAGDRVQLRPYLRALSVIINFHVDGDRLASAAAIAQRLVVLDGKKDPVHAERLLGILLSQGDLIASQVILDSEIPSDAVIQPWARACLSFLAGDLPTARIQIDRGRSESPIFEDALVGDFSHQWSETYDALMTIADHQVELRTWVEDDCPTTTREERAAAVASYADPVGMLLDLDEPSFERHEHLAQLADLGFTVEHIPELLRLANDQAIHECLDEDPAIWAPLHAVVALGQMGDLVPEDALMAVVHRRLHDEVLDIELREAVIARGSQALPILRHWLDDEQRRRDERVWAGETMVDLARAFPEERSDIVSDFMRVLRRFAQNSRILNAELVGFLAALGAVDAEPLVQEAYAASAVDVEHGGDFADWVSWAEDKRVP